MRDEVDMTTTADETGAGGIGALTPAEVELLKEVAADRQAGLAEGVQGAIHAAVDPLQQQLDALRQQVATMQEALAVLDGAAIKEGDPVGLRAAKGQFLSAVDGGPATSNEAFVIESRAEQGDWESFGLTRR
jgi:hypothetical protein